MAEASNAANVSGIGTATNWLTQSRAPQQPSLLETVGSLQSLANASAQNDLQKQDLLNKQQELANSQLGILGQIATGIALTTPPEQLTPDFVKNKMEELKVHMPLMAGHLTDMEAHVTKDDNATTLKQKLMTYGLMSVKPPDAQSMAGTRGTMQTYDKSGMPVQVGTVQPGMGMPGEGQVVPQGAGVPMSISPDTGTDLVEVKKPDGTLTQVPRQQVFQYNLLQHGWTLTKPLAGAATGATVTPPPTGGTTTPPPAAPAQSTLPLGQTLPNAEQLKLQAASRAQDTTDMASLSSRNFADLQGSLASIRNLSTTVSSGKGTEYANTAKQILTNALPNVAAALGIDPNKSYDQQDLWKALSRAALASGNRSDADLFTQISANPNHDMSPVAMRRAAEYVLALNTQESVLTQEAHAQATHDPLDTNKQNAATRLRIQNSTDQNAYRLAYAPEEEQRAYLSKLGKDERKKYAYTMSLIDKYAQPAAGMPATGSR